MPRSRGFCPAPVVKPSFQFFSLSSKATNSVASVVFSCPLYVDGVVMSFLLHNRFQGMEKSLPTTVRRRNQWTSIVSTQVMLTTRFHATVGQKPLDIPEVNSSHGHPRVMSRMRLNPVQEKWPYSSWQTASSM